MGLVINPTAFRIGHVKAWTDAWYLHRMHYPVFVHKSLEIKTLLQYILLHKYPSQWSHWIYSHTTYYYSNNKFYVSLFVYDGNDPHNYVVSAKDHKFGWYKKSRFFRYWTKKQLLDLQFLYQRWYFLCQVMNLEWETMEFDDIRWRLKSRHLRKIWGLKRKYGRHWTAREELYIWRYPISMVAKNKYNKMGIPILNLLYKYFVNPRLIKTKKRKDFDRVEVANNISKSYKILYFFFAYIDKILKLIPSYPVGVFNRLTYKACYRFFRMYFVFKPYWKNLAKLYELILLYINVNSKVKIFLLDNVHLNASYISRYIMTCLRLKFDYRDTMIPIKKTLLKIMFAKRWRPIRNFKKKNWQIYLTRYKQLLRDRIHFHLINNDVYKMFLYRFFRIKRLKRFLRSRSFKKCRTFSHQSLKKNLYLLKNMKHKLFCKKATLISSKMKSFKFIGCNHFKRIKYERRRLGKHYKFLKLNIAARYKFLNLRKFKSKRAKKYRKKYLKRLRIRRGHIIYWKKKYLKKLKLILRKIRRYWVLRQSLFSIFQVADWAFRIKKYTYPIKPLFAVAVKKLWFKRIYWRKKKRALRLVFFRRFQRLYKLKYRIRWKSKYRFTAAKRKFPWKEVKKWCYYYRRRFFVKRRRGWLIKFKSINFKAEFPYPYLRKVVVRRRRKRKIWRYTRSKRLLLNFFSYPYYNYNKDILKLKKVNLLKLSKKNEFIFFKKIFKQKFIPVFKKKYIIRGFSNLLFFNYLKAYADSYKPFFFRIPIYRKYLNNVLKPKDAEGQFVPMVPKKYNLEETPLKDKFKRLRILESGSRSLLFGYKFHFVGRFTRKQKAASLWFAKGANSVSSMRVDIDYGFYTIALRYSACTLKVWLYRNRGYSFKYGYRLV